ncbi:CPBP family intramembrane metalloprotease [Massilia sp. CCM 8733]|uniref:CPBP family intramembrane metalloprotease n=1 Tax=Massilia mucilaginosa TaxID=2609282 RepID=A0ABX0P218_9BURK|nr:CPBP family intramembrane glutamic endopeptidase [Massilia mucilaginosa]NHZ93265.1 CPBP family intramembrane metalloprotease [Massilia mucilaginosa]
MLDWLLAAYLLIILPCTQMWRSFYQKGKPVQARTAGYRKTVVQMIGLLAVLVASCWQAGRGPAALGLDMPVSRTGMWGLGMTVLLLVALYVGNKLYTSRLDSARRKDVLDQIKANEKMPRTPRELAEFVPTVVLVSTGWELLYRGFLLMLLTPLTGAVGAIILAALAYGIGHGYEKKSQLLGSIVSALLFTLAFYFTQSLWWLILLHIGLPLFGAISVVTAYRGETPACAKV